MRILSNCSHVKTIVWLHCSDFNKMPRGKARLELHKNVACCFELILKAALHKTLATSHLTNYLNKTIHAGDC